MSTVPPEQAPGGPAQHDPASDRPLVVREGASDASRGATILAIQTGDIVFGRAIIRRGREVSSVARLVRIVELSFVLTPPQGGSPLALERAIDAAVRHVGIGAEGLWDILIVRSRTQGDIVGTSVWRFARTMDYGCDMLPRSDDEVTIRVRVPGRRAAVAHFLLAAPRPNGLATLARTITYRIRRRAALRGRPATTLPEVHLILELPSTSSTIEPPPGVRFSEVPHERVLAHPRRYASYGIDADVRLRRGDRCFASEVDGRVVFRMWVSTNAQFIRQRSERLGRLSRAAYVYDSFTEPAWRGRSIRGASLHWLAGVMAGEADRIVLSVDGDNLASIRAARKAGFRSIDE